MRIDKVILDVNSLTETQAKTILKTYNFNLFGDNRMNETINNERLHTLKGDIISLVLLRKIKQSKLSVIKYTKNIKL